MKVFDIDAAIRNQTPKVRLRGELYPVADLCVSDRIRVTAERMERHEKLVALEEKGEDVSVQLQELQGFAIQAVLAGVPDDIAGKATEKEFEFVMLAVAKAKEATPEVGVTEESEAEVPEGNGGSADPEQS